MLVIRLSKDIEERLNALVEKTGRSKAFYAWKAIRDYLLEDHYLAEARLARHRKTVPFEEIEKSLGMDHRV